MISPAVYLRTGSFVVLVAAVVVTAGCQPPPPAPTFPVSGKVTVGKKALTSGIVTFTPDAGKGNTSKESAIGMIGADGTYKLITNGRDGAPLGWYKVSVTSQAMPGADTPSAKNMPKPVPINPKYQKSDTSGISKEVKEQAPPGAYDIDL